ncbi:MAG: dienelactone hydrolase family protein [Phycisphaerales bacterium]|nr:dienelactone hydrolase family protein [Phycisphaerales bacterium]
MSFARSSTVGLPILLIAGCSLDGNIFPTWPPNFFDQSPALLGTFGVDERRIEVPDGADGEPFGITLFSPLSAVGARPTLVWVTGSNVQAYYHQSLHETLASWGYVVIVPDSRPLTFTDFNYHRRNVDLAKQAIQKAIDGELDVTVDRDRLAVGGYSIGGTMAAFVAAEEPRVGAIVFWAPTRAPFWTGVDPDELLPKVTQPAYYLLAELDNVEPPEGFPVELRTKMSQSEATEFVIPQGLHLYFQQPTGADSPADPESDLTRFEQQEIAIERTRAWLDGVF